MNDFTKTLGLVAAAGALAGVVYFTRPVAGTPALISDQGQPLTPRLTDPLAVKSLEVISFDAQAAKRRAFKVAFDGKRWVIPSHSGYPADAADKVAASASAFAGLVKERVVTDDKNAHANLGVLEPAGEESSLAAASSGFGTRVTLRDASGQPVADLIIGKAPTKVDSGSPFDSGPSNKRYVREAGSNRVYITTLATGFSTKFIDWVQADLLQATGDQIAGIDIDRYRVDEARGMTDEPRSVTLTRPEAPPPPVPTPGTPPPNPADTPVTWQLTAQPGGGPGPGEVINQPRVDEAIAGLTGLRIVGVRPKPANLAKALSGSSAEAKLTVPDQISLGSRGFYLAQNGRLLANEGQMAVRCNDGVVYSLWFGEVVPDGEDAASGGQVGGESATGNPASAEDSSARSPSNARYLMITVAHEPTLVPEPKKPEALVKAEEAFAAAKAAFEAAKPSEAAPEGPATPAASPTPAAPPAEGEVAILAKPTDATPPDAAAKPEPPKESTELLALRQQHESAVAGWKSKLDNGKKRADTLGRRFADWYYVISADSLAKIRPAREELVKAEAPVPVPLNASAPLPENPAPLDSPK